VKYKNL